MAPVSTQQSPTKSTSLVNGSRSGKMPHATAGSGEHDGDDDYAKLMEDLGGEKVPTGNYEFMARDLETGEKAVDAIDYEDIDDDDLADEEEGGPVRDSRQQKGDIGGDLEGLLQGGQPTQQGGDAFDDLFGDVPSSPTGQYDTLASSQMNGTGRSFDFDDDGNSLNSSHSMTDFPSTQDQSSSSNKPLFHDVDFGTKDKDVALSKALQLQQQLFAQSGYLGYGSDFLPAPPEDPEELLTQLWPKFDRNSIPRFLELLPPKKAQYVGKTPLKPPKPIQPTKINLEIAQDQEKAFKSTTLPNKRALEDENHGLEFIFNNIPTVQDGNDDMDLEPDLEEELVGGVTMQDLEILCADWEIPSGESDSEVADIGLDVPDEDDIFGEINRPSKKRKLGKDIKDFVAFSQYEFPSFHDPERATAQISKAVTLDLNDPHLLIDERPPEFATHKVRGLGASQRQDVEGSFSKRLSQRFNISNDEAYDLLKENHQNKVRSTLSNLTVEHSLPAVRLQWPYYPTRLTKPEARTWHRTPFSTKRPNQPLTFGKPRSLKRKHEKLKAVQEQFKTTKDLSLGDNSSALLVEYSEENPIMMSNFGMGSRIINYYRRKDMEDTSRPKPDLGETNVLLPQDKSPFSLFGHVDPGSSQTTLHNAMFRAPLFQQYPKPSDFLIVRSKTGVDGETYYLRNVDHLYVAGQEFPSVDVPGPHSRKVTTAAKNRLKMVSYRRIKRNKRHRISVAEVTQHFPDTTDMQNRQKMKEFMQFSKEHKEWEMRPGEPIPDEDVLRSYIKPEDVCLLESMMVGQQHLLDAGYGREEDENDDDEGKEGQSLEQQLAPWHTSRNFLNATQGKAMLQLHGEGDPSGRGEAFSFIKTSMKGGFKALGESIEDKLDSQRLKEMGGHSYNVARQQKSYEDSIRRIWEAQKTSLSSNMEHSDTDMDDHRDDGEEIYGKPTPGSEAQTPAAFGRRDDDSASQFSRFSVNSRSGKNLRIIRKVRNKKGGIETSEEIIRDPRIIKQYLKRRHEKEAASILYVYTIESVTFQVHEANSVTSQSFGDQIHGRSRVRSQESETVG